MAQLVNTADTSGSYNNIIVTDTTKLSVELSALSISKEANLKIWLDEPTLEYTIEIKNVDDRDPNDPVTPGVSVLGVEMIDIITPSIATLLESTIVLVKGGVVVDDPDYEYSSDTGVLLLRLGDMESREVATLTFQVEKVIV